MDFKAVDERVPTWVCVLERERKKERKEERKKERGREAMFTSLGGLGKLDSLSF